MLGAGPHVPHPVEWQLPHELPEALITLSNLSIALSPFEKAVPCLLRAFEQALLKARAQMRPTRQSSSLYSCMDGFADDEHTCLFQIEICQMADGMKTVISVSKNPVPYSASIQLRTLVGVRQICARARIK